MKSPFSSISLCRLASFDGLQQQRRYRLAIGGCGTDRLDRHAFARTQLFKYLHG